LSSVDRLLDSLAHRDFFFGSRRALTHESFSKKQSTMGEFAVVDERVAESTRLARLHRRGVL